MLMPPETNVQYGRALWALARGKLSVGQFQWIISRAEREVLFQADVFQVADERPGVVSLFPIHPPALIAAKSNEVVPLVVEIENGGSSGPGGVARTAFHDERRNRHEKKVHQTR
jgi:hypothetical protein